MEDIVLHPAALALVVLLVYRIGWRVGISRATAAMSNAPWGIDALRHWYKVKRHRTRLGQEAMDQANAQRFADAIARARAQGQGQGAMDEAEIQESKGKGQYL